MDKNLNIIVAGKSCSGKSTIIYLIEKMLKENGINDVSVNYQDGDEDFSNMDKKVESIKNNKITINEINTIYGPIITAEQKPVDRSDIDPFGEEDWEDNYSSTRRLSCNNGIYVPSGKNRTTPRSFQNGEWRQSLYLSQSQKNNRFNL